MFVHSPFTEYSIKLSKVLLAFLIQLQKFVSFQQFLLIHTIEVIVACFLVEPFLQLVGRERWGLVLLIV